MYKRQSLDRPEDKADQKVDEELMAGKLECFFGELSAAWEGKPKVLVRAVMSKILSRLPVFFDSLEEVRLYVEGSLRSCSDVKEKEISMGLILRAVGAGLSVYLGQFIKDMEYSEIKILKKLPGVTICLLYTSRCV